MTNGEIGIETDVLHSILAGEKTVEGRLARGRFLNFEPGDILRFREDVWRDGRIVRSIPDRGAAKVTQILRFDTFEEMLRFVGIESVLPRADDLESAVAVYRQFYTPEDEKEHGVLAIFFELV